MSSAIEDGFPNLPIVPAADWQKEVSYENPVWLPLVMFVKEVRTDGTVD